MLTVIIRETHYKNLPILKIFYITIILLNICICINVRKERKKGNSGKEKENRAAITILNISYNNSLKIH